MPSPVHQGPVRLVFISCGQGFRMFRWLSRRKDPYQGLPEEERQYFKGNDLKYAIISRQPDGGRILGRQIYMDVRGRLPEYATELMRVVFGKALQSCISEYQEHQLLHQERESRTSSVRLGCQRLREQMEGARDASIANREQKNIKKIF